MRKIKILPMILMLSYLLAAGGGVLAAEQSAIDPPPTLESAAAVIIDEATGRVLYELNGGEQRYPASLTKVMTVLLAVEAVERGEASLDDAVTAGTEAQQGMVADGSTAGIQAGETMTLRDLMYCAMLGSANEACNIIAVHIAGSLDSFVQDMNERAEALGCANTHFANTHGLPDSSHYTTARDFAVITREAMSHEIFFEISSTVNYTVPATNLSSERRLSNSNGLINPECQIYPGNYYEYARAGKTGHTSDAGYCLASLAERDNVRLICVVLGGQMLANGDGYKYTNFTDSRALYTWVFNNFSMQEVLSATELVTGVTVNLAEDGGQAILRPESAVSALVPNKGFNPATLERDIVIFSEQTGEGLTAPIAAGSVLGEVTLSLDGVELGSANLVTGGTIELARSEYMKQEIAGFFSNIWVILIIVLLVAAVALYIFSVVRYRKLHRRHLESVAAAKERAAQRRESGSYAAVPPTEEEKTAVLAGSLRSSASRPAVHATGELEKTTVLAGEKPPAAPRYTKPLHSERPAAPERREPPAPRPPQERGSAAPKDNKARRDYFEEFFRNNGQGPKKD